MSADDLILFATIVEQGSLVRAADHLGKPKATVSRRLNQLEASIGQKLLLRTTRRLALTDFGREFLEHCQRVAEEAAEARDFANSRAIQPHGRLRISMPSELDQQLPLAQAVASFIERYPSVQLELDMSARRVDLIGEHYDLAVRLGVLESDSTLVARKIGERHFGLYASPAYLGSDGMPERPDDLLQYHSVRLLSAKGKAISWRLSSGKELWEGAPSGRLTLNSLAMVKELLLDGAGIASLPVSLVEEEVRQGLLVRILPEWQLPVIPVWAVMPTRRYLPTKTRLFLAHLEEWLQRSPPAESR